VREAVQKAMMENCDEVLVCSDRRERVGRRSAVLAQPAPPPLGIASPLGIGPGAPVAPTGVPLGATQLMTPGVSSVPADTLPQSAITGSNSAAAAPRR
jgi:hypothetical protein